MTMCSAESTADPGIGGGGSGGGSVAMVKTADTTNRNPNRRSNKPIMEKRRRARINNCLNELKGILLEAMRKDPARHSKLEKADILELTVSHLKGLHRHHGAGGEGSTQFRAGFGECAAEVGRFLSKDGIDHQTSSRLLTHLADCINNPSLTSQLQQQQQHPSNNNNNSQQIGMNNLSSHGPSAHHTTSLTSIDPHGSATTTINVPPNTPIISLVPSRLSSGEIAFVVPGFSSSATRGGGGGSSATPSPTIPLAAMQSLHCNPPLMSPEVPLELTVPSSSSSGCSLSPNYPVPGVQTIHHHHHHGSHLYHGGMHHSFSTTQPLALVTPKKEETDSSCWRPWG